MDSRAAYERIEQVIGENSAAYEDAFELLPPLIGGAEVTAWRIH
ncbi:MAG: hypothetical protein VW450_08720 [Chloroflexota bacterium]